MKIKTAIVMSVLVFVPMVALANPVTPAPLGVVDVLFLLLPVSAEIMVELRMLRLYEIWVSTSLALLVMHCITLPLLFFLLIALQRVAGDLPNSAGIFIAECAIVMIEAAIFYVVSGYSVRFKRSFPRCLGASAAGNLTSFLVGLLATWLFGGLQESKSPGRNTAEWLQVLKTDSRGTENPLRIVQVIPNVDPESDAVEVPLSWDLMRKNGLLGQDLPDEGPDKVASFRGRAQLDLLVNGGGSLRGPCWRATNGNCQLRYHHRFLRPGTNEIKVEFRLFANKRRVSVTGPPTEVEFDTRGLVPVMNNANWEKVGLAMSSLRFLRPKWRTRDIKSGLIEEHDGDWWGFFMMHEYAFIEWAEIEVTSSKQDAAVVKALRALPVPVEKTERGYRVLGYAEPGKPVNYLE